MTFIPGFSVRSPRFAFVVLLVAASVLPACAQPEAPDRAPLPMTHPLSDKNFYLCSLIEQSHALRGAVDGNEALTHLKLERRTALRKAIAGDDREAAVYASPFLWTSQQIALVADVLRGLYRTDAAVREATEKPLRASGVGPTTATGGDLLAETWTLEAEGMNRIVAAYGEGKTFENSDIDGLAYDANSEDYREFLHQLARNVAADETDAAPFFASAVEFSLGLLEANQRDEAGRFEPLETGENAAPLARLKSVDWSRYSYAAILVPGMGPELPGVPLSPMGMLRVVAAANLYKSGRAPFLLLSGGYVHPRQTPYNEAVEMKKALMRDFQIPEEAILIDPHARHTTTNLRNAARILFRDSLPLDKPVWIVSDIYQSRYIESQGFADRCSRELGYRPFRKLTRLSPNDLEWVPDYRASLVQDPRDPLDP
jgi:DUF218 domain-containing protein